MTKRSRKAGRKPRKDAESGGGTPDTRTLILDAAEELFAERGLQGVSVRKILKQAGVNVALAHYHFGGREGLIREVLRRRFEPLNQKRLALLSEVDAGGTRRDVPLEEVLRAFLAPVVELLDQHPEFARFSGQLHISPNPGLRILLTEMFEEVLIRFSRVVRSALPTGISDYQRVCRAHFLLGTMIHLLTNYSDLVLMARGRFAPPRGEALLNELVAFCSAGLKAGEENRKRRRTGRKKK